jgi:hypothetical protein
LLDAILLDVDDLKQLPHQGGIFCFRIRLLPFSGEREFRKHGENGQADVFETPAKCQGFQKLPSPN